MNFGFFYRVNIHCWGGLGSQLYAWSLLIQLQDQYPNRIFVLVLHNSGVTRRNSELSRLIDDSKLVAVDDFKPQLNENLLDQKSSWVRKYTTSITRFTALIFRLTVRPDFKSKIPHLSPWTRSIRGHYSQIPVPQKVIAQLLSTQLLSNQERMQSESAIGLHYRLGDLLILGNKSPMQAERLVRNVLKIAKLKNSGEIEIFSDSPAQAEIRLSSLSKDLVITIRDSSIWDTLRLLSQTPIFIGTHSKISLWVSILRSECNEQGAIYLPEEMKHDIFSNLVDPKKRSRINFY